MAVVAVVRKALARQVLEVVAVLELMPSIGSHLQAQRRMPALWEQAVRVVQQVVRTLVRPEVLLHSR